MRKIIELIMKIVFLLSACISVLAVAVICYFLFSEGLPAIAEIGPGNFLGGTLWKPLEGLFGILPMIIGSIYVTAGAILIGVPIGLLCAIFMAKFCPAKLYRFLKPAVDLLAGIPSIVYGLFGALFFVKALDWGLSLLSGAFTLAIMILPLIMRTTEEALKSVPDSYREGSFGLGAGRVRTVFRIILPTAIPGILAGIILAIGRIVGESAALIFSAGTIAAVPESVFDSTRTLSVHMYCLYSEGLYTDQAAATAVILLLIVIAINWISNFVAKRITKG